MLTPAASGDGPRELVDHQGALVARLVLHDRGEWRQADVERLEPGIAAEAAADLMRGVLAGMRVATLDRELAQALVDVGGHVTRAGSQLELDLEQHPPHPDWSRPDLPRGVALTPYDVDEAVAAARAEAYGPQHPDHDPRRLTPAYAVDELRRLVGGDATGPLLSDASVVLRRDDAALGGVVVTLMPRNALWAGPWVADVFVTPSYRGTGLGAALLRYAVAAVHQAGHRGIALTVTDANPARAVYERLGFVETHSFTTVALPAPQHEP